MKRGSELRAAIAALPDHLIGGYEWECYSCHRHPSWLVARECPTCNRFVEIEGEVHESGRPTPDHDDLIRRADVLALLDEGAA